MTKTSGFAAAMLAAVLLAAAAPRVCYAGHFALAFQRQLPAWENSAGLGCIGGHVCRVWVWDENGNALPSIQLKTTWNVLMGATDGDGRAEVPLNLDDYDLVCVDAHGSTSDATRLMTAQRPECWGHYSFEVGFLYKTDASNPGEFDLDLLGTWNERAPATQDNDAPYTKSLAYNSVDHTDYWSDQSYWGNWQSASSYFGQTFVATANRVIAARVQGIIGGNDLLDWKLQIVAFPGLEPVGPVTSVPFRWPFGWEAFWGVNDNPVVPGRTYMLKAWRDGEGMNIYHVTKNVYAGGQYYEGSTAFPQYDLNRHIVCMSYGGAEPQDSHVKACFKLDESSGPTAADGSGNAHHGTLYGSPVWQPANGKIAGALLFDGIDDYVETPGYKGITGPDSRTVAAWVKTNFDIFEDVLSWGAEATGKRWSLITGPLGGASGIYVKDGFILGTTIVTDGNWHHIAAVLENDGSPAVGEVRLYVDGRREAPGSLYPQQIDTAEGDNVRMAAFNDGTNRYFQGLIDDVVIFDLALADEDVARLYHLGGQSFLAPCGRLDLDEELLLDGDIDRNCRVDAVDFTFLGKTWLETGPMLLADIHQDNAVNWLDAALLAHNWTRSVAPPALDEGLAAHFKLDESSGLTAEESIAGNDGALHGSPTWQPAGGHTAGAIDLDGIDDYISTAFTLDPADGPFSAFAWIKAGAPGQAVISQTNGAGTGKSWLAADLSAGKLMTDLRAPGRGSLPLVCDFIVTDGRWHHVGIVWDGSFRYLYVDGAEVNRDATAQAGLLSATGPLYFGAANTLTAGTFFHGLIDDIRIYSRALNSEEAAALAY